MYHIDIMTLFPDTVGDVLSESILGRAQERDLLRINTHQIRDYTLNKQKQVDDYPYGGGHGAVLQADPLYQCWTHICRQYEKRPHTICLSPCGKTFTQTDAKRLAWEHNHLILVCGHYEGLDQRFIDECVDEEISLGDFVLTGGEIAAMAVADAVCRLVPGVLSDSECFQNESHWDGLLEYPQYSRPEVWHGRSVPPELLTGNHAKVERWRRKQSLLRTRQRRPDLYEKLDLSSKADQKLLAELERELSRTPLPQPVECRPAREDDLDAMETILAQAKAALIPIGQWNEFYPAREDFVADMVRGECHVLTCGGEVGGFFTLTAQPEPSYDDITDGKWSSDGPYAVVHRCAVAEQWRGSGLAGEMAAAWEKLARGMGLGWLRVDTHRKNKPMLGLLRKSGFQYRGNVLVDVPPPHDPRRVAYEKRLKSL